MRFSRMFRPEEGQVFNEVVPLRRTLFWVVAWVAIAAGIVLFFKYARRLAPLLD